MRDARARNLAPRILLERYPCLHKTVPLDPDEPADGSYEWIEDFDGVVLRVKNPDSGRWVTPKGATAGKVNATRKRLIEGSSSSCSVGKRKKKSSLLPKKISSETMKSDSKKRKRVPDDMDCDEESSSKSIKKQENIRYRILKQKMQSKLGNSWVDVMKEFFHDKFRNFLNRLTGVEEFDIDSGESIVNPVGSLLSNMNIDSDE